MNIRIGLALGLIVGVSGLSCGMRDLPDAELNDAWLSSSFESADAQKYRPIEKSKVYVVREGSWPEAATLLADRKAQEISVETLHKLCPVAPATVPKPWKAFLVRCVSTGDPLNQCIVQEDGTGQLWMDSGIMTHTTITSVLHTPEVVLLKAAPREVYVTFSQAE
jgi:hypothetical protein